MIPVAVVGVALAEAAVTAATAMSAAVAAASAVVVANALSEKVKEAEKMRADTSNAVPSAKVNCPHDADIKTINEKIAKKKGRINDMDSKGADMFDEIKKLEEENKKIEKDIEKETDKIDSWNRSNMEKIVKDNPVLEKLYNDKNKNTEKISNLKKNREINGEKILELRSQIRNLEETIQQLQKQLRQKNKNNI